MHNTCFCELHIKGLIWKQMDMQTLSLLFSSTYFSLSMTRTERMCPMVCAGTPLIRFSIDGQTDIWVLNLHNHSVSMVSGLSIRYVDLLYHYPSLDKAPLLFTHTHTDTSQHKELTPNTRHIHLLFTFIIKVLNVYSLIYYFCDASALSLLPLWWSNNAS